MKFFLCITKVFVARYRYMLYLVSVSETQTPNRAEWKCGMMKAKRINATEAEKNTLRALLVADATNRASSEEDHTLYRKGDNGLLAPVLHNRSLGRSPNAPSLGDGWVGGIDAESKLFSKRSPHDVFKDTSPANRIERSRIAACRANPQYMGDDPTVSRTIDVLRFGTCSGERSSGVRVDPATVRDLFGGWSVVVRMPDGSEGIVTSRDVWHLIGVFGRKCVRDLPHNKRSFRDWQTQVEQSPNNPGLGEGLVADATSTIICRVLEIADSLVRNGRGSVGVYTLIRAAVGRGDARSRVYGKHPVYTGTGWGRKPKLTETGEQVYKWGNKSVKSTLTLAGAFRSIRCFADNADSDGRSANVRSANVRTADGREASLEQVSRLGSLRSTAGRYSAYGRDPMQTASIREEVGRCLMGVAGNDNAEQIANVILCGEEPSEVFPRGSNLYRNHGKIMRGIGKRIRSESIRTA